MEENLIEEAPPADAGQKTKVNRLVGIGKFAMFTSLCILIALSHYLYTSTIFENDRNFSHLSELEREMSLRTEMGFYYSYYKTLVQEYPFAQGISRLMYDKMVEHPKEVNSFNRFNIHPEVIMAALYRYFEPWLNTSEHVECFTVQRPRQPPVQSCTGLGVPMMFYLEGVWVLAGVTLLAVFLHATMLSESILGGVLAVLQYYANHREATRVQWAPNERENFAWPLLVLQSWLVCLQLKDKEKKMTFHLQLGIFFLNCMALLFWQFSQFVFLTQTFIFFLMEQLYIIDIKTLCVFLHAHFCGLHMAVLLLQGNDMLKSSLFTCMFLAISAYCLFFCNLRMKIVKTIDVLMEAWLVFLRICTVVFAALYMRKAIADFLETDEDSHIWELFFAKFHESFANFHTLLYSCSAVYSFLPMESINSLINSSLLPTVAFVTFVVVNKWLHNGLQIKEELEEEKRTHPEDEDSGIENVSETKLRRRRRPKKNVEVKEEVKEQEEKKEEEERDNLVEFLCRLNIEPEVFYCFAQLGVYGVMALLVMRLKLLFVTQLCIVSALMVSYRFYIVPSSKPQFYRYIRGVWMIFLLPLAYSLITNVSEEFSVLGEFSDPHLEELIVWIRNNTAPTSAFAGSMPLMASVLLSARRPVVLHPHYEHYEARMRAYAVYKVYGRFSSLELYKELTRLRASYLIVEWNYCYGRSRMNCTYEEIWDIERPSLRRGPTLCRTLRTGPVEHLYPVYDSSLYTVYRVHDMSLKYMPRSFDT